MFGVSALDLARFQFAFTMSFHILFPAVTIGLASYLAVLELSWLRTKRQVYVDLYHFWLKIFAVMFGMGVVSGIVMAYQIGTNWSYMSEFAGSIMGPVLAYEVLTAFFLEAGFLGVMLFGWTRVGPGLHFLATCMVAVGTLISATWILAANSWMQTPQGYAIEGNRMVPADWLAIVFNPSFPYRLMHMVVAAYLTTALIVGATGAWQLLRRRDSPAVRKMLSMAMWMLLLVAPIQAVIGDFHGLNTAEHQPAKLAAMEGHWQNEPGEAVPLLLFGVPDMEAEKTRYAVGVPHLGSVILTHSWNGQIPGLKQFAREDRPNSLIVFWSFRLMVGLGLLMIALGAWSLLLRRGGRIFTTRPFLRVALWMGPAGLVAILAGWVTTEVGRQPWVVYGVLRTADAVSPHGAASVGLTLALFVVAYFFVFGAGTVYVLRMMRKGPQAFELHRATEGGPGEVRTPMRPMSAADVGNDDEGTAEGMQPGGAKENEMGIDTSVIWAVIIYFSVFMYVVLDGFDLGIGMLFPFVKEKRDRDTMMNTVAPVWDGNETWLVLGGEGLLLAFPVAYSIILTGLYLPLIFMLIGLVFRGVAFEFRFKAKDHRRHLWDKAFIGGSVVASYFQGVSLGAFLNGITVSGRSYAGGALDWVAPFPLLAGFGVMIAYTLLGSTWLIMKTEGDLHKRMVQVARPFALMLLGAVVVVSIWTPLRDAFVAERWFSFPNIVFLMPVPVLVLLSIVVLLGSLKGNPHRWPFVAALALVFLGYTGMAISIWPHIVPPFITIWEAASPPASQGFALVGTLFILPVILMYTVWSYWVFRGKVKADAGYH